MKSQLESEFIDQAKGIRNMLLLVGSKPIPFKILWTLLPLIIVLEMNAQLEYCLDLLSQPQGCQTFIDCAKYITDFGDFHIDFCKAILKTPSNCKVIMF